MKKLFASFYLLLLFYCAFAQTPYKYDPSTGYYLLQSGNPVLNDKNWDVTNFKFFDDFNSETFTKSVWTYGAPIHASNDDFFFTMEDIGSDNVNPPYTSPQPYNFYHNNHLFLSSGNTSYTQLISKVESPVVNTYSGNTYNTNRTPKQYSYTTGLLLSINAYKYGYYEARFKINVPVGNGGIGIGSGFWLYRNYNGPSNLPPNLPSNYQIISEYSELDIAENNTYKGLMTSNAHLDKVFNGQFSPTDIHIQRDFSAAACNETNLHDAVIDQTNYHTYACEWTPTEVNTYYDGKLVRHIEWPNPAEFDPMNIYLDIEGSFSANGNHHRCNPCNSNTQFPFYYNIDYVKIYQLNTANCANDVYISSNYNWNS